MGNEIQIFNNPAFGAVRSIVLGDEPYFVGRDVAEILGYKNPNEAIQEHVDAEDKFLRSERGSEMLKLFSSVKEMQNELGRQDNWFINESGIYSLVFTSQLPSAKAFKRWVTSEVLPSIRKTGKYEIPKVTPNPHYRSRMLKTAVKDCAETADIIAKYFGVKPGMARAAAMQMVGTAYGIDTEPLRELIPAEEKPSYLTPTAIAEKIGLLTQKGKPDPAGVNRKLAELGLQEKTPKGWQLTTKGKEYGECVPYSRNGHSGYQIHWGPEVVEVLKEA